MASVLSNLNAVVPAKATLHNYKGLHQDRQVDFRKHLFSGNSQLSFHQCIQKPAQQNCKFRIHCSSLKTEQEGKTRHLDSNHNGTPQVLDEGNVSNGRHQEGQNSAPSNPDVNGQGMQSGHHAGKSDHKEPEELVSNEASIGGSVLAIAALLGTVAAVGGSGYVYKDQIYEYIQYFESIVQGLGPAGYVLFVAGYALLELVAIPAIPLTMSAGLIFGVPTGTILVSIAGTIAATVAFLIARYALRDRIMSIAKDNKKFMAIDKAIGKDSFRVVLLLRLSPLLPFSLGNYIYGITSVELLPYVFSSWLGMLPGTWAYVSAGSFGRSLLEAEEGQLFSGSTTQLVSLAVGILATVGAAAYVTTVAKGAVKDIEE